MFRVRRNECKVARGQILPGLAVVGDDGAVTTSSVDDGVCLDQFPLPMKQVRGACELCDCQVGRVEKEKRTLMAMMMYGTPRVRLCNHDAGADVVCRIYDRVLPDHALRLAAACLQVRLLGHDHWLLLGHL